jgi:hypothetical protein
MDTLQVDDEIDVLQTNQFMNWISNIKKIIIDFDLMLMRIGSWFYFYTPLSYLHLNGLNII